MTQPLLTYTVHKIFFTRNTVIENYAVEYEFRSRKEGAENDRTRYRKVAERM